MLLIPSVLSIESDNYNATATAVSGDNVSSTNYQTHLSISLVTGNISSANYETYVGVYLPPDETPPQYSLIDTLYDTPVTHSSGLNHVFYTNWTDTNNVTRAWFVSTWVTNITMSESNGTYYVEDGVSVGEYTWRSCARDPFNNENCTPIQTYIVLRESESGSGGGFQIRIPKIAPNVTQIIETTREIAVDNMAFIYIGLGLMALLAMAFYFR